MMINLSENNPPQETMIELESVKNYFLEVSLETWFLVMGMMLVLTVFLYLVSSGLFSSVTVSTCDTKYGPITFAYKTHTGPYKNVGDIFTESYIVAPDREQLGIYYDDPEGVSPDQLRAAVGPILAVGQQKPDPAEMEKVIKEGFKIAHLPKPSFVVSASFPFRSTMSIFIAIYRVYPRLRDYISERNLCAYPALEVYTDSQIIFMMPLSRQEEFFVPEFQEDEMSVATTDLTGSVMVTADDATRDKDGFLIPQRPDDSVADQSDAAQDNADQDESNSEAGEEDAEDASEPSIETENCVISRDS